MFQFTGFASLAGYHIFNMVGCPIRIPADHIVCADPHGFSQLITSFFASGSLGIPHTPLLSLSPRLVFFGTLVPSLLNSCFPEYIYPINKIYTLCLNMSMNVPSQLLESQFQKHCLILPVIKTNSREF